MNATAPTSLDTGLMFLLSWASHALATEHTVGLAELGITPRAHCVLYKAMAGDMTQTQVAEACGLDKTTMVVTMDRLEKDGLAKRRPSSADRRARIISVTEKGQDLIVRANEIVARIHEDVLAALPVELRKAFVEGLVRLVDGRLSTFVQCENPPQRRAQRSP
jgi:MarR family transcriptional regulator for hemolysin